MVHNDDCKAEWEALEDREKARYGYERELLRKLDRLLDDLRKKIAANSRRLDDTRKPSFLAEDQSKIEVLNKQIIDLLAKAAELGEQGDVDAAEAATKAADDVREKKAQAERFADSRSGSAATRGLAQSVCPVSGLIINDEESRLRDHHAGKNYNAWASLHAKHAALQELIARRASEARRSKDSSPRRDLDDSRSRRRDADRDRRRRRSRSRSRDKGRSHHHRRSSRRQHSRSRSRSRSRSGSRDRYRSSRRHDRDSKGRNGGRGGRERERDRTDDGEEEREATVVVEKGELGGGGGGGVARERSPEEGEVQD